MLGEFEREVAKQNITFVESEMKQPPTESEVEPTSKEKVKKKTSGFYISKRGDLHSIKSETESEEEIYAYEGKKRE